jgi:hypothetical protein
MSPDIIPYTHKSIQSARIHGLESPALLVFTATRRGPSTDSLFWGPGGCRMFAEERREEHAILKEFLDVKPPPDTTF